MRVAGIREQHLFWLKIGEDLGDPGHQGAHGHAIELRSGEAECVEVFGSDAQACAHLLDLSGAKGDALCTPASLLGDRRHKQPPDRAALGGPAEQSSTTPEEFVIGVGCDD
jgi:hypothetical protein